MPEEIKGMDDLLADLEELTLVQSKQVMSKALRNAAKLLAEEQEHLVPRDTGKLSRNINFTVTERTASEAIAKIGPRRKVFYAMFQNYGTKFQRPGDAHFVERAFDNKKDEAYAIIRFELGKFIDQAMRKSRG